jgi:hypothetical protein
MQMKKSITFFVTILILLTFFSETGMAVQKNKKLIILINGLFSLTQKMGSNNDYIAGENDFPVTPAHNEFGLGCALMFNLSDKIAIQLAGDYLFGTEVNKEDPSDGEIIKYRTYDNINLLGSVMVKFGKKNQFFASCGGGLNILNPYADKEVEGSLESLIIISAPDSKVNLMASLGGGAIVTLKKSILKIEVLYNMIFNSKKNSILLRMGIGF